LFHDRHIFTNEFAPEMKVRLYDSRLHLFLGKLRSRWAGPYIVSHVFSLWCSWNSTSSE